MNIFWSGIQEPSHTKGLHALIALTDFGSEDDDLDDDESSEDEEESEPDDDSSEE